MKKVIYNVYIIIVAVAALAVSCSIDDAQYVSADELGAVNSEYFVPKERGSVQIQLYANKSGDVQILKGEDWVRMPISHFDGDASLTAEYSDNPGFPRRAVLLFSTATRKDTVSIFQNGLEEVFDFPQTSAVLYNGQGELDLKANLNVPIEKVDVQVRYLDGDLWITSAEITQDRLCLKALDNEGNQIRRAQIHVSYQDGWDELRTCVITINQANKDNKIGTPYSFEELRSIATTVPEDTPTDAYIEGYIVSDLVNGQAGELRIEEMGVIDTESNNTTAYFESIDGKYGFKLQTLSAEDNIFHRNMRVGFILDGAKISKSENFPTRYTISEVSVSMIMTAFDEKAPVKEKRIKELTDDDIYTCVTLTDCEIPMRKGPLTPIHEGYTPVFNIKRYSKYPMLIRCIDGGSMYMITNYTCPYRRDGSRLPYGSGNITGVIVHEDFPSFDPSTGGFIGNYQIRHFYREDIDLAMDMEDSFSALAVEFRYLNIPSAGHTTELPKAMIASYGDGELTHSYSSYTSSATGLRFTNFSASYFYLGPCGKPYAGTYSNGAGIILEDGTDYLPVPAGKEGSQNSEGKGDFSPTVYLSWGNKYWWNSSEGHGYAWIVKFSTLGISTDHLSMQFAMYNNSQKLRSPRYWKAQYSFTTYDCSASSDEQWTDIGTFVVPDVVIYDYTLLTQSTGTKVFDFELPLELLDREKVYIRLLPINNKACALESDVHDGSTIANNSGYNTMDYFAIRYNKRHE